MLQQLICTILYLRLRYPQVEMAPDGILENQPGEKRNTWLWMSGCAISSSSFLFGYSLAALNTCIASDSVGSILNDIQLRYVPLPSILAGPPVPNAILALQHS